MQKFRAPDSLFWMEVTVTQRHVSPASMERSGMAARVNAIDVVQQFIARRLRQRDPWRTTLQVFDIHCLYHHTRPQRLQIFSLYG